MNYIVLILGLLIIAGVSLLVTAKIFKGTPGKRLLKVFTFALCCALLCALGLFLIISNLDLER